MNNVCQILDKLRESEICFRVTTNFCGYFDAELGHYYAPTARIARLSEFRRVVEWLAGNTARIYPDSDFTKWWLADGCHNGIPSTAAGIEV